MTLRHIQSIAQIAMCWANSPNKVALCCQALLLMAFVCIYFQTRKISPVFKLQPSTVYLVKEFDNIAVFPHESSGRFNRSLIDPSAVYEVSGEEFKANEITSAAAQQSAGSPFGAYTGPTAHLPPRQPLHRRKGSSFRKTMALVTLSIPNSNKPTTSKHSSHLEYQVITQVVVTLEVGQCKCSIVADLVRQQVGFPVTLLDSKCFPIMENETTNAMDFWKSNRKILAASSSLYSKLTGSSTNPDRAKGEIDLTHSDDELLESPARKCPRISAKLDQILDGVQTLRKRSEVFDRISSVYECKDIMQKPQFGPCCRMIVGCQPCVQRWFDDHDTCPHCSTSGAAALYTHVRGMDDMLTLLRTCRRDTSQSSRVAADESSDSDFELPAVNFRGSQN